MHDATSRIGGFFLHNWEISSKETLVSATWEAEYGHFQTPNNDVVLYNWIKTFIPAVSVHEESQVLRFLAIVIGTFSLTTNSAVATESTPTTQDCNDRDMTFEDWRQWVSITPKPVRSEGHRNNWVSIYVNEIAESTYRSASSPYPFCSKIVKPIFTDANGTTVRKLTIMVKLSPGYDPENADWWYGVYDASGTAVKRQGVLWDCIPCHKQAAETDYLFSKEVGHALSD